jgi:hypothetical protein
VLQRGGEKFPTRFRAETVNGIRVVSGRNLFEGIVIIVFISGPRKVRKAASNGESRDGKID